MSTTFLSIVVPLYNEEDNVEILYDEIRESIDRLERSYEIIFVDDGSSDSTFECLKSIQQKEKSQKGTIAHTRIIRFSRNFGQTAALQAGFDYVRGQIAVSLDGDLQNNPADIPLLLAKLDEGYDVVCGWRKHRQDKTLTRVVPSVVANWLIGKITGVNIHDNGCSLKTYRGSVIKSITLYSDMHRFIPAITSMMGVKIAEMVVDHRPRRYGLTKYGLARIWKVLFDIVAIKMLIHFHMRPFFWFAAFACLFGFFGLIIGIASFIIFLKGDRSIVLTASCFLCLFLSGSLTSWGLLAEFFVKIETTK